MTVACQDVMRAMRRGASARNSDRFPLAVLGEPRIDRPWGLRIEGHHPSKSWTMPGGDTAAMTPASFSVIPKNIPVGDLMGMVVFNRGKGLDGQGFLFTCFHPSEGINS